MTELEPIIKLLEDIVRQLMLMCDNDSKAITLISDLRARVQKIEERQVEP